MTRGARTIQPKHLRKAILAIAGFGSAFYFIPYVALFFIATGLVDVLRNEKKDRILFDRYFLGNGLASWLLSPLNLALDLLCFRNKRIYKLDDFPPDCRKEIEDVLSLFVSQKQNIIERIDRDFQSGRRGMFVYRWFGRAYNREIAALNRSFKHIQTIAVSVFEGKESTAFHFGPFRATLRVLYNLTPVESDDIFIECGYTRHRWHQDPLFVFDDTLMHRSVNLHDARRYCVFMDVVRPSPVVGLLSFLLVPISAVTHRTKGIFYQNWRMLGESDMSRKATTAP